MLNYTSQALDGLKDFPVQRLDGKTQTFFKAVEKLLKMAVRIELPENGAVLDDDSALENFDLEVRRLPFKVVAFEFPMTLFDGKKGRVAAPKRIALAFELRVGEPYADPYVEEFVESVRTSIREATASHQTEGFLGVIPLCYLEDVKHWTPILGAALIGYLEDPEVTLDGVESLPKLKQVEVASRYRLFPWIRDDTQLYALPAGDAALDVYYRMGGETKNPREVFLALMSDLEAEVLVVIRALVLLSANNVMLAPAKGVNHKGLVGLNKKRAKAGKSLIRPAMEIVINPGRTKTASSAGEERVTPDRKSPDTHWRRGHIRRLPTGKRTWVRPALVGAVSKEQGTGKKYYRMKPLL